MTSTSACQSARRGFFRPHAPHCAALRLQDSEKGRVQLASQTVTSKNATTSDGQVVPSFLLVAMARSPLEASKACQSAPFVAMDLLASLSERS